MLSTPCLQFAQGLSVFAGVILHSISQSAASWLLISSTILGGIFSDAWLAVERKGSSSKAESEFQERTMGVLLAA